MPDPVDRQDNAQRRAHKVAVLGGGMAGLTAAWELSDPANEQRVDVTVYQRGWRLGGKGASSRGVNGRIEEHGLHVLLGHYHHTFDLMQACYDELDRPSSDPEAPILSWHDAVQPSGDVSLAERSTTGSGSGEAWDTWSMAFRLTEDRPGFVKRGDGDQTVGAALRDEPDGGLGGLGVADLVSRTFALLIDFAATFETPKPPARSLVLSNSPSPPRAAPSAEKAGLDASMIARALSVAALATSLELTQKLGGTAATVGGAASADAKTNLVGSISDALGAAEQALLSFFGSLPLDGGPIRSEELARTRSLVDLVITNLRGVVSDGLLGSGATLSTIDHLDYREWLASHGASRATIDSGIVRGMYDLVFAYAEGDQGRPAFSAGLGVDLATRMLLGYRGGVFWKMQAGMGEVIFAPLYEALERRGVCFEFFHNLDSIRLAGNKRSIESIELTRQATTTSGDRYRPLIHVGGLPAWPAEPLVDQLAAGCRDGIETSEAVWHDQSLGDPVTLRMGEDFDSAVLAVSLGIIPLVCAEIVAIDSRWQAMVRNVSTVPTQALQLWLKPTDTELGWTGPSNTTLSGFRQPFDTWASMAHLIERESWPSDASPGTIAYFCSVMAQSDVPVPTTSGARAAQATVADAAQSFMNSDLGILWPRAVGSDGFRRELLVQEPRAASRPSSDELLDGQYWRANIDPSDRYVQSLPGTGRHRLKPGDSGYSNLTLAGDWTDCGLNAGCIEAAVRSGLLAGQATRAALAREGPSR